MLEELFVDRNMKWKIIILFIIGVIGMVEIVNALCFPGTLDNPFCIFGEEEVATQEAESQSSSGGSNQFQTPRVFYEIDKNYPIEILDKNCFKTLKPNITEISKSAKSDELSKISLNQMKYEDKGGKVTYLNYKKNNTICHNLELGFSARWGFGSTLIFVNNTDVGVYINSYYNETAGFVQRNKSFSEGYYITPVILMSNTTTQGRINSSWNQNQTITYTENLRNGTWTQDNYTLDGDTKVGTRTKNISTTEEFNLTDGLLAYWDFDGDTEGVTTCTDIFGDNDGTILSESIGINLSGGWDNAGYQDDGVDNDANGCKVASNNFNAISGNFTAYFNYKRQDTNNIGALYIFNFNNDLHVSTRSAGDALQLSVAGITDEIIISNSQDIGVWHSSIVWYNGTNICFSTNGVEKCDASTGTIAIASGDLLIGARFTGVSNVWNGSIDNLIFWNRSLTPQERAGIVDGSLLTNWTSFTSPQTDTGVSEELFNYSIGFGDVTAVAEEVVVAPLPPSSTIEIHGQSIIEIYETDKLTIYQS